MALPLYSTLQKLKGYNANPYSGSYGKPAMTEYEQQLYPYVQQVKQEHERKFNLWQPIEFVFDLLSRGQYMTANTAKQFITNLKSGQPIFYGVPREIWQGLSGQEKGDWGTVLWGGQDVGERSSKDFSPEPDNSWKNPGGVEGPRERRHWRPTSCWTRLPI